MRWPQLGLSTRRTSILQSLETRLEGKAKFKESKTLDLLCTTILRGAFGDDDPEDDPKIRSVLGAVILAANPAEHVRASRWGYQLGGR
jgi:hypothetical protein